MRRRWLVSTARSRNRLKANIFGMDEQDERIDAKYEGDFCDPIVCVCDDEVCPRQGIEGEVPNHIEQCSCRTCHQAMGSVL